MAIPTQNKVAAQLPFDFPLLNSYSFDDFAIGNCNEDAVKYIKLWPNWQHHALMIVGPEFCGKTHLIHSFKKLTGGELIDAANLPDIETILSSLDRERPIVLLDNAHLLSDETALFHIFNSLKEAGGWLLLAAAKPPQQWNISLPDLLSRLKSVPLVQISAPDEGLLRSVLIKQFSDRQLQVNDAVINFLIARMERSFVGVMRLAEQLDKASLVRGKKITVPLAREVIEAYNEQNV